MADTFYCDGYVGADRGAHTRRGGPGGAKLGRDIGASTQKREHIMESVNSSETERREI